MDLKLAGKTALVTGATAGIGLAIAERLVTEGVRVIVPGRSADKLAAARAQLAKHGSADSVVTLEANPATAEGAAAIIAAFPDVDILVNNLGIYEKKDFADITDDDWRRLFEVNVLSGARLSRHYFPRMLENNSGRIIFIASESALLVPAEMVHYGMTKTAQLAISRGLAVQTKGTKVTVNTVLPGPTRSEGIADFLKSVSSDPTSSPEAMEAEFFKTTRPLSLLQRMIEASEVADLVAFVASPLSAATNGAALRVDGGITPTIA